MKRFRNVFVLALCLVLTTFMLAGCDEKETSSVSDSQATESVQSSDAAKESEKTKKKKTKKEAEKKEKEKQEKKKVKKEKKNTTSKSASRGSNKKAAKAAKSTQGGTQKKSGTNRNKKPSGHVLTVKKSGQTVYFTEQQLRNMGTVSYRYSFRNKESSHRQFQTFTGVRLSTVLSKSGFSGSTIRVTSSDGYARNYAIGDLKSAKKAFKKKTGTSSTSVPTILTIGESCSFRLCFGQKSGDTDASGDYNMQYWAKWIKTIEVY